MALELNHFLPVCFVQIAWAWCLGHVDAPLSGQFEPEASWALTGPTTVDEKEPAGRFKSTIGYRRAMITLQVAGTPNRNALRPLGSL